MKFGANFTNKMGFPDAIRSRARANTFRKNFFADDEARPATREHRRRQKRQVKMQ